MPEADPSGDSGGACADISALEARVLGQSAPADAEAIDRHAERCDGCRLLLIEVAENLGIAERLVTAVGGSRPRDAEHKPRIRGFDILEAISAGGQGKVYRGTQGTTGREVAIKVIHGARPSDPLERERFLREARLSASLRHPAIVTTIDAGRTDDGDLFLAMEFVDGVRLDQYRAPSADTALALCSEIADGVHHAHAMGVIHRDIKESNILIDRTGRARILDFGLAKSIVEADDAFRTTPGTFVGTLAFAAPEQLTGSAAVGVRADIYALGVVFYRLFTGRFPHPPSPDPREMLARRRNDAVALPSALVPGLDADIDTIVRRMLAVEPERRYATALDVKRDLDRRIAGAPIEARRDEVAYVLTKMIRRYRIGVLAGAFAFLVAVTAAFAIYRSAATAAKERDRARTAARRAEESLGIVERAMSALEFGALGPRTPLVDLLDRMAVELESSPTIDPAGRAALLLRAARVYSKIAAPPRAEAFIARARSLIGEAADADPRGLIELDRTALLIRFAATGDFRAVGAEAARLARIAEKRLGADDPLRIDLDVIAAVGRMREAPADALREIESLLRRLGDRRDAIDVRDRIAYSRVVALTAAGRMADASAAANRLLESLSDQSYATKMMRIAVRLSMTAGALDAGETEIAHEYGKVAWEEALAACERDDPKLARAAFLSGMAAFRANAEAEASPLLERFLEMTAQAANEDVSRIVALDALVQIALAGHDDSLAADRLGRMRVALTAHLPTTARDLARTELEAAKIALRRMDDAATDLILSAAKHAESLNPPDAELAEEIRRWAKRIRDD